MLAALRIFPFEAIFHKYGAGGFAWEKFVERQGDDGHWDIAESLNHTSLDHQVSEAVMRELEPLQLTEHDLRQLVIVRNLIHRDFLLGSSGLATIIVVSLLCILVFLLGVKLIAFGRHALKLSDCEQDQIRMLTARVRELESKLDR